MASRKITRRLVLFALLANFCGPAFDADFITGQLGFLLCRGIFERSIGWVIVGALLPLAYGGMIFGILPGQAGVSWQGHLFGFIPGIMGAWVLFQKRPENVWLI